MVSNHASMSLQHPQILAAAEVVNLRERVVRAAVSAGTHMSRAGSPARRWAPGPVSAPPGRPDLPPLGIPSRRSLAPRFGIIRSRARTGQNLRERKCPRVPGLGDTGLRDTLRQAQAGAPADCGHAAASQPVPRIIILTGQPASGREDDQPLIEKPLIGMLSTGVGARCPPDSGRLPGGGNGRSRASAARRGSRRASGRRGPPAARALGAARRPRN